MTLTEEDIVLVWREHIRALAAPFGRALGGEDAEQEALLRLVLVIRRYNSAYCAFAAYMDCCLLAHLSREARRQNLRLRVESRMSLDQPVKNGAAPVGGFFAVTAENVHSRMELEEFMAGLEPPERKLLRGILRGYSLAESAAGGGVSPEEAGGAVESIRQSWLRYCGQAESI